MENVTEFCGKCIVFNLAGQLQQFVKNANQYSKNQNEVTAEPAKSSAIFYFCSYYSSTEFTGLKL